MNFNTYIHKVINNHTGDDKTLGVSVIDWADLEISHIRHEVYNSVLFEEAITQKFPKVGGRIYDYGAYYFITDIIEEKGVKADITYQRYILNPYTNDYELDFEGALDFSADSGWAIKEYYIKVKVIDSRKLAKFLSRDEIEYNIFDRISSDGVTTPAFTNEYIEAEFNPVDIYLNAQLEGAFSGNYIFGIGYGGSTLEVLYINEETIIDEIGDRLVVSDDPSDSIIYNNETDEEVNFKNIIINYDFNLSCTFTNISPTGNTLLILYIWISSYDEDDNIIDQKSSEIYNSGYIYSDTTISPKDSGTINMNELIVPINGYVRFRLWATTGFSKTTLWISATGLFFNIDFSFYEKTSGAEQSSIRGMLSHEAMARTLALTTSETDTTKIIYSPILGNVLSEWTTYSSVGFLSREHLTNGWQLRGFVDRALNLSSRDIFKSLNAIKPIGLWYDKINDYFYIDSIHEFYQPQVSDIHLGYVNDLEIIPYKKKYYNTILSGYPNVDYEDFQGVNECNTETEHTTIIETKNKLDVRSPYYADTIGQELARRKNKKDYASEDTKYDSNIYINTVDGNNVVIQGNLIDLSGWEGIEQYYNLNKTPRCNLTRSQAIIKIPLLKDISDNINFLQSEKNTNLNYDDPTVFTNVNEYDNIPQETGIKIIYEPFLYKFEGIYTKELRDELKINPHQAYPFYNDAGEELYGYVKTITGNPYKKTATFELIKANNDRL